MQSVLHHLTVISSVFEGYKLITQSYVYDVLFFTCKEMRFIFRLRISVSFLGPTHDSRSIRSVQLLTITLIKTHNLGHVAMFILGKLAGIRILKATECRRRQFDKILDTS